MKVEREEGTRGEEGRGVTAIFGSARVPFFFEFPVRFATFPPFLTGAFVFLNDFPQRAARIGEPREQGCSADALACALVERVNFLGNVAYLGLPDNDKVS